jgi:starvation-inducible outer membrane lipoprotein
MRAFVVPAIALLLTGCATTCTPNEIDYTNYSSYGERAKAQADAVLSGLKYKFGGT